MQTNAPPHIQSRETVEKSDSRVKAKAVITTCQQSDTLFIIPAAVAEVTDDFRRRRVRLPRSVFALPAATEETKRL